MYALGGNRTYISGLEVRPSLRIVTHIPPEGIEPPSAA